MRVIILLGSLILFFNCGRNDKKVAVVVPNKIEEKTEKKVYKAPDTTELKDDEWGRLVKFGARLVRNTSYYIGPEGKISRNLGNKMNCTNCHLEAGTKPYGLNFFDSHRTYPQYRARENT